MAIERIIKREEGMIYTERIETPIEKRIHEKALKTVYWIIGGITIATFLASIATGLYVTKKLHENYSISRDTQERNYQEIENR